MTADFSHDDVFAKMDALLKKHHEALTDVPAVTDLPVLTEVVEESLEWIPLLTEVVEDDKAAPQDEPEVFVPDAPAVPDAAPPGLGEEALAQLDRQIRAALDQRLPVHILEAVDKALPIMIEELSLQLEGMVRDAVAQELKKQLGLPPQQGHGDDAE